MTKLRKKIRQRIRELREQSNWEKFYACISQLESYIGRKHDTWSMERLVAGALFELLKVPQWKLWIWIPKMLEIRRANNLHIKCCDIDPM